MTMSSPMAAKAAQIRGNLDLLANMTDQAPLCIDSSRASVLRMLLATVLRITRSSRVIREHFESRPVQLAVQPVVPASHRHDGNPVGKVAVQVSKIEQQVQEQYVDSQACRANCVEGEESTQHGHEAGLNL